MLSVFSITTYAGDIRVGSEQQGEAHVDNGQGSTPEQIAMETSNEETDNGKVSKLPVFYREAIY